MEISSAQLELMKHTVSDHNRNWFATNYACRDSAQFELLVEGGFATKEDAPGWMGDDVIYRLTDEGRSVISKANENQQTGEGDEYL